MTSPDAPRPLTACGHDRIVTYRGGGNSIWACAGCSLRFYPACRTCVDVGHRNVEHPPAARSASPDPDLDVDRLAKAMEAAVAGNQSDMETQSYADLAVRFAAEYRRLSPSHPVEPTE